MSNGKAERSAGVCACVCVCLRWGGGVTVIE